jgi:hypothetical protein
MNLTILTLILLPVSALLIYLLVKRFTKNNYPSKKREIKREHILTWDDNILDANKNSRIILKETIIPGKKEIDPGKKKYPRKKTSSSPSIAIIDELPKSNELPKDKKSSPKKSYYKKKKSSKKDKGDNLLLS